MSARLAAVEQSQTEFRQQISEVLLSNHNNEEALRANTATMNSLATMVMSIMNKLETKSVVSEPLTTTNNEGTHGGVPKSTCENQAQTPTARKAASNTLPIDVVADSEVIREVEGPVKEYRRLTRSKDAKLKGVTASQENSQVGVKGRGSEKGMKKGRAPKGGARKGVATETGNGEPVIAGDASQEVGPVVGVEAGSGPPQTAVARTGVQDSGEGGGRGPQGRRE